MKNPLLLVDNYKLEHVFQYPEGMSKLYSNFTPRASRIKDIDLVVVFGIQKFIKDYLIKAFDEHFFCRDKNIDTWTTEEQSNSYYKSKVLNKYKKHVKLESYKHIEDLWDLGYLPIEIKALPEGTKCPIGVPMLTITNTLPEFAWLVNYLETLISTQLWQAMTSATISNKYREIIDKWSFKTTGTTEDNEWMGHDFSMRGMSSVETAIISGMAHLLSFRGTDVVPAIYQMEEDYNVDNLIAGGVPATEHSVMCMGQKEEEIETFRRLLKTYPTGILSVVSDTWDLWKVVTEYLPILKDEILARDGKLVIRPDSGNPADIICGKFLPDNGWDGICPDQKEFRFSTIEDTNEQRGVIQLLWDIFGGTINEQGYKVLDPHIGLIYGDGIGLHNLDEINSRLEAKEFATTNWVAGFGSYGYQYNTRDTFGFAMKATYGEISSSKPKFSGDNNVEVEAREIFKDPITDSGTKKSAKGLLQVYQTEGAHGKSKLQLKQSCTWEEESQGLLQTVFKDGKLVKETTLDEIKERLGTL